MYCNRLRMLVVSHAMKNSRNRERFVRLAEKRVARTIKDIRLIGNLSNRSNYSYNQDDVRKILGTLETELKNLRHRFETQKSSDEIVFKL
jgi:hypothetical protein